MSRIYFDWTKDPDETMIYSIDWRNAMLSGDTIATVDSSTPTVTDPVLAVTDTVAATAQFTDHEISGGLSGTTYLWTVEIVTAAGETLQQPVGLKVRSQ